MSFKSSNEDADYEYESDEDSDLDTPEDSYDDMKDFCHVKNLSGKLEDECKPLPNKVPKLDSSGSGVSGIKVLRLLQEPSVWVKAEDRREKSSQALSQNTIARADDVENRPVAICAEKSLALTKNTSDRESSFPEDSSFTELDSSVNNSKCTKLFSFPLRKIRPKTLTSYDPSKPSWFDKVPEEVILRILSFLPKSCLIRFGRTCKNFFRLATDESLWKRIDLGGRNLPDGVMGQVISRGVTVMRLTRATLTLSPFGNQFGVTLNESGSCKLQYLDLSMAVVSEKTLADILRLCRGLKKLALENCQVSERVCFLISENTSLEVLHLGMTTGLNHIGLIAILSSCTDLVELNLAWTGLPESTLDVICDRFHPNLLKLNLSGNRDTLFTKHIADIVKCCEDLTELDVSDCTNLNRETVRLIYEKLPNLEALSASRCYNISPSSFIKFKSTPLKYLNIFGLVDKDGERELQIHKLPWVEINKQMFSTIARPTCGVRRSAIWNLRVREQ